MVTADSKRRRRHIRLHSAMLLLAMAALLSYCGWIVAEWDGILWSLVGGAMMFVLVRRVPPNLLLQAIGARPVARWEEPMLYEILDALCRRAGVDRIPNLCWVAERFPVAFTIGQGEVATIALSRGLVSDMTACEIRGILAHEVVHIRNGDLALMQLAIVAGQLTRMMSQIAFLLVFFQPLPAHSFSPELPNRPVAGVGRCAVRRGPDAACPRADTRRRGRSRSRRANGRPLWPGVRPHQDAPPGADAAARPVSGRRAAAGAVAVSRSPGNRRAHPSSPVNAAPARFRVPDEDRVDRSYEREGLRR